MTAQSTRLNNLFPRKAVRVLLMGTAASLALSGIATSAHAQDAVDEVDEANVITVVARKQTETLQEVPVTVTAIGGDTLEKFQVNEIAVLRQKRFGRRFLHPFCQSDAGLGNGGQGLL